LTEEKCENVSVHY